MIKNILVTGGAGFIGSHLCETLLLRGYTITVLDNFNDYYSPVVKRANISEVTKSLETNNINPNRFKLIVGDIRNITILDQIFRKNSFDCVIHLAAMAGVRNSIENPGLYMDVNLNGTANLLNACRKYNIKKFIFASSSSVYGNNEKVPFCEQDPVDNPISPYAMTKKAGELLTFTFHHLYKVDVVCLRFFTVYGPRQRPDLAIHKFTDLIYRGMEVPFFGNGTSERDYTYISDIIQGISNSLDLINNNEGVYEIINLGESRTISLNLLLCELEGLTGKKANIKVMPKQLGDVEKTYADITKAKRILSYNPSTPFQVGLKEFFCWYKNITNYLE